MGWIGQISSVVFTAHKEGAQKHGNHCGTSCLGPRWETPIFWRLGHRQVRSHYIQTTRNFWRILPDLFSSTRKLLLHLIESSRYRHLCPKLYLVLHQGHPIHMASWQILLVNARPARQEEEQ